MTHRKHPQALTAKVQHDSQSQLSICISIIIRHHVDPFHIRLNDFSLPSLKRNPSQPSHHRIIMLARPTSHTQPNHRRNPSRVPSQSIPIISDSLTHSLQSNPILTHISKYQRTPPQIVYPSHTWLIFSFFFLRPCGLIRLYQTRRVNRIEFFQPLRSNTRLNNVCVCTCFLQ